MKKIVLLALLFAFFQAFAQSQPSVDEIRNSGKYLVGTGQGSTYKLADNAALDNLITQISVQVQSDFTNTVTEVNGNFQEYVQSIVKTYSNVTLSSAKSLLVSEKRGAFEVMRYISFTDLEQLFENRKNKISAYIQTALKSEAELRIGDALRNYYWALLLLQSHKNGDAITAEFPGEGTLLLKTALPDRINNLLANLKFRIKNTENLPEEKYKAVYLEITSNGKPVSNLDFTYWTGRNYSNLQTIKDGLGMAEFFGDTETQVQKLKIVVEYAYEEKSKIDLEVKEVMENISLPPFDMAEFEITLPAEPAAMPAIAVPERADIDFQQLNKIEHSRTLKKNVLQVVEAIRGRNYGSIETLFTPDGWVMFDKLITSATVKVLPFIDTLGMVSLNGTTIVRSVPMKFSYKNNSREFIENVVFTFNSTDKIEAVSFSIGDQAISDIASKSSRFGTVEDKYQLIQFMEYYKTAYCLKRLDYIEDIFADNALIIVGHVVQEAEPIDGMYAMAGNERVKFIELSKNDYIERLRNVFASNEYVNIQFEDNLVTKVNGDDKIYGIQIRQYYYSTNYADQGYLFLMIDLNDSINPKIYVRTWQPEKNPDGSIFGLSDFRMN